MYIKSESKVGSKNRSFSTFEYLIAYPTSEAEISISTDMGPVHMRLCRLIYTSSSYFNSKVFDQNIFAWKHGGMDNGRQSV